MRSESSTPSAFFKSRWRLELVSKIFQIVSQTGRFYCFHLRHALNNKGVRCLFWNIEKRGIWQQFRASSMSNCSCARVIYYHFTVDSPVWCSGSDKSNFLFTARRLAHFFRRATRWAVVNLLVREFSIKQSFAQCNRRVIDCGLNVKIKTSACGDVKG